VLDIAPGAEFTATSEFDVAAATIEAGATFNMGATQSAPLVSVATPDLIVPTNGSLVAGGGSGTVTNSGTLGVAAGLVGTIVGNYDQTATGKLALGAASTSSYGRLVVTGSASLPSDASIFVNVSNDAVLPIGGTLVSVLQAGTLTSSTFDVTDNSSLVGFSASQHGQAIDLTMVAPTLSGFVASAQASGNTPGLGAAGVLDHLLALYTANGTTGNAGLNNFLSTVIAHDSTTAADISNVVSQSLPALTGAAARAGLGATWDVGQIVQAHAESGLGLAAGDGAVSDSHLWFKPFGSWARQDAADGASGYKADTGGFVLGADAVVSAQQRVGLGFSYADSSIDSSSASVPSSARSQMYRLIGYGSYDLANATAVEWQADVGGNSNSEQRQLSVMSETAGANYDSVAAHARVGLARLYELAPGSSFTPSVNADYAWVRDAAYTESGAGALDLNVAAQSASQMVVSANGKFAHELGSGTFVSANLGLGYDLLAKQNAITAAFAGDPSASFVTLGVKPDPWIESVGLALTRQTGHGVEVQGGYDVQHRLGLNVQTLSVKVRWLF
jgi:outer membrane autotransporter protein